MIKKAIKYFIRILKSKIRKAFKIKKMQLHGVWVELTHNNISPELKTFFYKESYEEAEIGILSKHLSTEDVVMEIGAGIGFLSAFCAKQIGSNKVFAYEANPFMIDKIKETYQLNSISPTVKNLLLADKEKEVSFYLEKNFWSSSTVKRSNNAECVQVESVNVNQEIEQIKPSLLIVDIEGGEKDLIPVIDFDKNEIQKLIIELHPHVIGKQKASDLIAHLIKQGFSLNFEETKGIVFMFERCLKSDDF
jgi:FkbM family methyltransferase